MIKKIIITVLVLFAIAQFFNPKKNQSAVVSTSDFIVIEQPPEHIKLVIKSACYDCHSNDTKYPWYDRITPVNYWVEGHIKHAKEELNFSSWEVYSSKKKVKKIEECIEMIEEREMPLKSYVFMHKEAKISDEDINSLTDWLSIVKLKYQVTGLPM